MSKQPEAKLTAQEAVENARQAVRSQRADLFRRCGEFVRGICWDVPARFPTAISMWEHAEHQHPWTGDTNDVPFGAPFYFMRQGDPNSAGHVMITGGHYAGRIEPKGVRIFFSTDIKGLGEVHRTTVGMIEEKWGLTPLGWTHDINGFWLPLPKAPNA